ncbi:MAG: VWA domain-containing protein [Candidatus Melainabacteria bacterium]|nr:VWA domain-containing protein [Candidatus Melainabacteria bacterium]
MFSLALGTATGVVLDLQAFAGDNQAPLPPVSPMPEPAGWPMPAPSYQPPPKRSQQMYQGGANSAQLQTGTQNTMLQTGTQNTMLQTGTAGALIQSGTASSLIRGGVDKEAGPVNILILLDASFSMKEKLEGNMQKMDAAKMVLQQALARVPSDVNLGLRVFGQGYTGDPFMDCKQSALLVPLGQGNRRSIIERVRQVHPYGLTPLEFALRQAAENDLAGLNGPKTLILISDGADTCGGNPCEFIKQLPRMGIKLKVDIVGLSLKHRPDDVMARHQLNCITETSGGKYYDANTAAQLIESISASVNKAISGRVIMKPGVPATNIDTPVELQEIQLQPMKAPEAQTLPDAKVSPDRKP